MGNYKLVFRKSVAKDLRSIPNKEVARILQRIEELQDNHYTENHGRTAIPVRVNVSVPPASTSRSISWPVWSRLFGVAYSKKAAYEPRIMEVQLWTLNESFVEIPVVGRQQEHQKARFQNGNPSLGRVE